ncbi:MAG: HAMP domain-containing protein [Treponema sp.]|nr:HAMP domain-containing protein [Treponema sp.]
MKVKNEKKNADIMKVRFSIGAKMIILISFIVILSLGAITALVSWLFYGDLRVSAEENNFEANRRAAMEAEMTLENMRSHSRILMRTITAAEANTQLEQEAADFFFAENQHIAAVFFITQGSSEKLLVNRNFFASREIDAEVINSYFENQRNALGRVVRGETLLLNAAPHFTQTGSSIPVLALIFPWQNAGSPAGAGSPVGAGGVLFSSENMNQNFGFGTNQSYMINSDGDLLSHTDFSLIRSAVNLADENFIRAILDSPQKSRQQIVESDFKYLQSADSEEEPAVTRQFLAFTRLNRAGAVVITGIEYDKVFEGIAATTRRNLYLTAAVLSISIIFIWFFAKSISVPLKALTAVAQDIEGGNFAMDLKPKGRDEIGVLTNSFQKMCAALNIFGRFTNKEIAVKAMRGEIKPGGLPKHATVFFSDIRNFTAMSENFTKVYGEAASDLIVKWLNEYFTQMVECVEKTNGVVDKFIGDAVMAHWGAAYSAGSPAKDAFNCVKAALMMRNALYAMNKERQYGDPSNPPIQIGCGINSGIVTAGQLGSDMRMEYTVIGDPVNLASRIESLTKPLGADIIISEDTWQLIGDKFITEEMPSVTVKGKEKPVRIFAVINIASSSKTPQTLDDVRKLLGIEAPDMANVNVNADELKYKIDGKNNGRKNK